MSTAEFYPSEAASRTLSVVWPNGEAILCKGDGVHNAAVYPPGHGCLAFPGCPVFPEHWAVVHWYPSQPGGAPQLNVFGTREDAVRSIDDVKDRKPAGTPRRRLICACCGRPAWGRQWYNRDTGYGVCPSCGDSVARKEGETVAHNYYGVRGVHWDCENEGTQERRTGELKASDVSRMVTLHPNHSGLWECRVRGWPAWGKVDVVEQEGQLFIQNLASRIPLAWMTGDGYEWRKPHETGATQQTTQPS